MIEIMISIHPQWCSLILDLNKRWELRKTCPKSANLPYRCYIYQTNGGGVVGEFICDSIEEIRPDEINRKSLKDTFVEPADAEYYANGKILYKWRIRSLIAYSEPKDLSQFGLEKPPQSWCYIKESRAD